MAEFQQTATAAPLGAIQAGGPEAAGTRVAALLATVDGSPSSSTFTGGDTIPALTPPRNRRTFHWQLPIPEGTEWAAGDWTVRLMARTGSNTNAYRWQGTRIFHLRADGTPVGQIGELVGQSQQGAIDSVTTQVVPCAGVANPLPGDLIYIYSYFVSTSGGGLSPVSFDWHITPDQTISSPFLLPPTEVGGSLAVSASLSGEVRDPLVVRGNTAEGGTNGVEATTANSGGLSGDAWNGVNNATYTDSPAIEGSLSYRDTNAGGSSNKEWNGFTVPGDVAWVTGWWHFDDGYPEFSQRLVTVRDAGNAQRVQLDITGGATPGRPRIRANGAVIEEVPLSLPLDTDLRWALAVDYATDSISLWIETRSERLVEYHSPPGQPIGAAMDRVQYGVLLGSPAFSYVSDDLFIRTRAPSWLVWDVAGALAVEASLAGTLTVPTPSVPNLSGALSADVGLAGTLDVPTATVHSITGALPTIVGLAGVLGPVTPAVPDLRASLDFTISLAGDLEVPTATVPVLNGAWWTFVTLAGALDVPPAQVPSTQGALGTEVSLSGALDVPTASVPDLTGALDSVVTLFGTLRAPEPGVDDLDGSLPTQIALGGVLDVPTASVPDAEGTLPTTVTFSGTLQPPSPGVDDLTATLDTVIALTGDLGAVTPITHSVSGLVSVEASLDGQLQPVVVPLLDGSLTVTTSLAGVLAVPPADVADLTASLSVEVVFWGDLHDPGLIAPCSRTLYIDAAPRLSAVRPSPRVRNVAPAPRTSRVRGGCCG